MSSVNPAAPRPYLATRPAKAASPVNFKTCPAISTCPAILANLPVPAVTQVKGSKITSPARPIARSTQIFPVSILNALPNPNVGSAMFLRKSPKLALVFGSLSITSANSRIPPITARPGRANNSSGFKTLPKILLPCGLLAPIASILALRAGFVIAILVAVLLKVIPALEGKGPGDAEDATMGVATLEFCCCSRAIKALWSVYGLAILYMEIVTSCQR